MLENKNEMMVLKERKQAGKTFILYRREFDKPTEEGLPEVPSFQSSLVEDLPRNRLGLAKWLIHPDYRI
ncbi:hypothetical protein [Lunatimonas salinarum]|uniref:hypothetical protein n=1 Tax=Lunatimonas salinarum TaxID=1774590 RepID=UPI001AE0D8C3|nr:hypothetical protein [Lunatimonas salinarum]